MSWRVHLHHLYIIEFARCTPLKHQLPSDVIARQGVTLHPPFLRSYSEVEGSKQHDLLFAFDRHPPHGILREAGSSKHAISPDNTRLQGYFSQLNQKLLHCLLKLGQILLMIRPVLVEALLINLSRKWICPSWRLECTIVIAAQVDHNHIRLPRAEIMRL